MLSVSLATTRERSVVILGLVEKGALESDLSFGLTTPIYGYMGDVLV